MPGTGFFPVTFLSARAACQRRSSASRGAAWRLTGCAGVGGRAFASHTRVAHAVEHADVVVRPVADADAVAARHLAAALRIPYAGGGEANGLADPCAHSPRLRSQTSYGGTGAEEGAAAHTRSPSRRTSCGRRTRTRPPGRSRRASSPRAPSPAPPPVVPRPPPPSPHPHRQQTARWPPQQLLRQAAWPQPAEAGGEAEAGQLLEPAVVAAAGAGPSPTKAFGRDSSTRRRCRVEFAALAWRLLVQAAI